MSDSRRHVSFFKPFLLACNLCGIGPCYDFNRIRLQSNWFYPFYSTILKMGFSVWFLYEFYTKIIEPVSIFVIMQAIITVQSLMGYLSVALVKDTIWEKLFQQLTMLESTFYLNDTDRRKRNFLRNSFLHSALQIILVCLLYVISHHGFEKPFIAILAFYGAFMNMVCLNLALSVRSKFSALNHKLLMSVNDDFTTALTIIRKCRLIHVEMAAVVKLLNTLFGLYLLVTYWVYGFRRTFNLLLFFIKGQEGSLFQIDTISYIILMIYQQVSNNFVK
ncbi:hypothetical protein GWI33_022047 [Rhynchophorus ferrugineus]|uniref:Uncharacterized protein n=1 Tax=Rhynchophorus ferrugineus TaxID=354439 RepID=A0A834IV38_RHYFE|nr:hypothetical protein GWI33_022047 [Rhynchophorus ferrugineus]